MSRMCPRHLKNRKAQAAARPDRSSRTRAKRVPAHRSGTLLADGTALRTNRAARLNPLMHSFALSVLCSTHELWQSEYVRFPVWLLLRTLRVRHCFVWPALVNSPLSPDSYSGQPSLCALLGESPWFERPSPTAPIAPARRLPHPIEVQSLPGVSVPRNHSRRIPNGLPRSGQSPKLSALQFFGRKRHPRWRQRTRHRNSPFDRWRSSRNRVHVRRTLEPL